MIRIVTAPAPTTLKLPYRQRTPKLRLVRKNEDAQARCRETGPEVAPPWPPRPFATLADVWP